MDIAIATLNINIGGYEYVFVNSILDRLLCKICHLPSRDPYLSVCCGHLFCKSCLDYLRNTPTLSNACPICRNEGFVTYPNKAVDREIKSLYVYCTNKVMGCEWQGELNDINNHLGNSIGCQFEKVKCFNECGKMIERRYLTIHDETECPRRKVNCQYCNDTGEHQFIEGQHKEECPKLPLPCPNQCEVESVPREDMEAHRKECPLEMIQCEYYSVGCEVRMARKDQEKHKKENMEEHLMKTHCKLTDNTNQLANTLQRISILEASMHLTMDILTRTTAIESSLGWSTKLAAMAIMSTSGDQVCPVILKMSNYNSMKRTEVTWYSDSFYTHDKGYKMCMKIYPAGHDIGKGTHLSCYLILMRGPHDDNLSWPLRDKFEIKLLNQISDYHHHSDTVDYGNTLEGYRGRVTEGDRARGCGNSQFISNEDLYKITLIRQYLSSSTRQYLKDDCLFFQIVKL